MLFILKTYIEFLIDNKYYYFFLNNIKILNNNNIICLVFKKSKFKKDEFI